LKARIRLIDQDVLTKEELVERIKQLHGCQESDIEVFPDSDDPLDYISFGIQQLITHRQIDLFFESGPLYEERLVVLRRQVLDQLESELDRVIVLNEDKLTD